MILVVGLLFILAAMAAHLVAISEVASDEAFVSANRSRLTYAAESAIDRTYWMLLADRSKNGNRTMGSINQRPDPTQEVWMADGTAHEFEVDGLKVRVAIKDAESGLDVSGPNAPNTLRGLLTGPDQDKNDELDRFLDIFQDYLDADDVRRLHGKEREDYIADGWQNMPRNPQDGKLQYREEIFWLDGLAAVMQPNTTIGDTASATPEEAAKVELPNLDSFRIIPPAGISFFRTGKPSFFGASPSMIQQLGGFNPAELSLILDARQRWFSANIPLEQSIPELYPRLNQRFSLQESGVCTFIATAISESGDIRRELRITRDCRGSPQSIPFGNINTLVNWDQLVP